MTDNTIRDSVQSRYENIAQGDACCDENDCDCESSAQSVGIYDADMLQDLPVDVTGISLGCGDPVTIASLQSGETVLDLGSGGGIDCFLAARQVGQAGYVIGVDMTPAMLEKARANQAKLGLTNVDFRQGFIEDLPVESDTIDIILSNCVINLSPQKKDVFAEALRVLKPGGRLVVSDIVTEGDFSDELRADVSKWAECVTGAIDVDEYIGLMRQAGFTNIQIVDKVDAEGIVERQPGMPRLFSARITAYKPQ